MRLLRLYILNCGIFKKTVIDFTNDGVSNDMICLNGVNGTGKTTIMDLVANLMMLLRTKGKNYKMDLRKPNVLTFTEFAQLDILIDNKVLSIVYGDEQHMQRDFSSEQAFLIFPQIGKLIKSFEAILKIEDILEKIDLRNPYINLINAATELNDKIDWDSMYQFLNKAIFTKLLNNIENSLEKKVSQNELNDLPYLIYFSTGERQILDMRYDSIPKREFIYDLVHIYHSVSDDLNGMLVYYDYAYPERFLELRNWINSKILVGKQLDRIERPDFKAIIKTQDGDEHGLELLSSGEENLLIIAVQMYMKASRSTVFLIDEVDQSLHPEFQEKLMTILRTIQKDFNSQIIVSSHSRFVWKSFEDKEIIRLTELIK